MPNWIEGSLKLRGTYENVLRFFEEGLNVYNTVWNENKQEFEDNALPKTNWMLIEDEEDGTYVNILGKYWAHVDNSERAFVTSDHGDIFVPKRLKLDENDDDPIIIVACEIHQAWSFKADDWAYISKKYNVDLKLYGIECGMGFDQRIIVLDGNVVRNEEKRYGRNYDEFLWDCPIPWLGG